MSAVVIRPVQLTRESFAPFGDVIETDGRPSERINAGHTQKFSDLFKLDVSSEHGSARVSLYRSEPLSTPFLIESMERHPLGSQAFIPLHDRPFPIIVAAGSGFPQVDNIVAFLSNGRQGVNLAKGTWHHFQLTLEESGDYIVIDRQGPGNNLEEWRLDRRVRLEI